MEFRRDEIERAALRLAGNLVRTPVVGALELPGQTVPQNLRVKVETLQPSGSVWYRGALHVALRALGTWKGVVTQGRPALQLAQAHVARGHRVPVVAIVQEGLPDLVKGRLLALGAEVVSCPPGRESETAARIANERGFTVAPADADREFQVGLATLGLELASELPLDTELVIVAPAELAAPVAAGLRAGGAAAEVGVATGEAASLAQAARDGMRLVLGAASLSALAMGLQVKAAACVCVVLSD